MSNYVVEEIELTPEFYKNYKKIPTIVQNKFERRLDNWRSDPFGLNYKTQPLRSNPVLWKFSIDKDYRVLFHWEHKFSRVIFHGVFNHNELRRKGYY